MELLRHLLLNLSLDRASISVTLSVKGLVVDGDLISPKEFVDDRFTKSVPLVQRTDNWYNSDATQADQRNEVV
jgi:hypothetical protein